MSVLHLTDANFQAEVLDATTRGGLSARNVDVAPMALYNSFRYNYPEVEESALLIDLGARTTNLIFSENGRAFSRSIPIGGHAISAAIAKEFELEDPEENLGAQMLRQAAEKTGENVGDGGLKPCREVGHVLAVEATLGGHQRVAGAQNRSFQAREGEVTIRTIQHGAGQAEPFGVARFGGGFDGGAARLWQAQKAGGFVEGFARCIIDGSAKAGEGLWPMHHEELAMAARYEKHEVREGEAVGEARCECVARKMVDANQG